MSERKIRTVWSDDEWSKLADIVETTRLKNPGESLLTLVNNAQSQFPADRRRNFATMASIEPLVEELKTRYSRYRFFIDEIQSLKAKASKELSDYTLDEILQHIPVEDILTKVDLPTLASHTARLFAEALLEKQLSNVEHHEHSNVVRELDILRKGLKKICVLGPNEEQQQMILQRYGKVAKFYFVKDTTSNIPESADFYLAWIRFCSHAVSEKAKSFAKGKYAQHISGFSGLLSKIEGIITE